MNVFENVIKRYCFHFFLRVLFVASFCRENISSNRVDPIQLRPLRQTREQQVLINVRVLLPRKILRVDCHPVFLVGRRCKLRVSLYSCSYLFSFELLYPEAELLVRKYRFGSWTCTFACCVLHIGLYWPEKRNRRKSSALYHSLAILTKCNALFLNSHIFEE